MQTFLPYPSFLASAASLDMKRLGKQRVECLQILNSILNINPNSRGWINHPCTKMWTNHPSALLSYSITVCDAWTRRGYKDTVKEKLLNLFSDNRSAFHDLLNFSISAPYVEVVGIGETGAEIYGIAQSGPIFNVEITYNYGPSWLGDEDLHLSHQSNLIRKNPEFYRQRFGPNVPDNLPYIWPV